MSDDSRQSNSELQRINGLVSTGQLQSARGSCEQFVRTYPSSAEGWHAFAVIEFRLGNVGQAIACINRAHALEPRNATMLNSRGIILQANGRLDEAVASFDQAIAEQPSHAHAYYNRGFALQAGKRYDDALLSYSKALEHQPNYPEARVNRANVLQIMGRQSEALADYDAAVTANPRLTVGWVNRGAALHALDRMQDALDSYDRALQLEPRSVEALHFRGMALQAAGRFEEALGHYEQALALRPTDTDATMRKGSVLQQLRRFDEARQTYQAILDRPHSAIEERALHDRAVFEVLWCIQKTCAWEALPKYRRLATEAIRLGHMPASPFLSIALYDDPALQLDCARQYWSALHHGPELPPRRPAGRAGADRIRIGYLSGDFHDHATMHLLAGIFESHDRSKFGIRAYSYGPDDRSRMRERVTAAFDEFVDLRGFNDREAAMRIAADRTDILVDLKGFTEGHRPRVVALRPAPLCAHYIGYPGTLGSPAVDYLIADSFVIPAGAERHYREAIVRVPGSYQANDRRRLIEEAAPRRADVGLPDGAFVFCGFCQSFKLTPEVFDIWMKLLRETADSVLWLLSASAQVETNLRHQAATRGVDPQRLVFAPRISPAAHLARHPLADLLLDTWPCGAHTTASDALWVGVPVITLPGNSFASRVAGSLLHAIGLPELIAASAADYETLAIDLARDRSRFSEIRKRLSSNKDSKPLFDTELSCRHLERAFEIMWDRFCEGNAARSFAVIG